MRQQEYCKLHFLILLHELSLHADIVYGRGMSHRHRLWLHEKDSLEHICLYNEVNSPRVGLHP